MTELILHSFEAGRRGKPDELESRIAHLIGAHLLAKDRKARFDLLVSGGYSYERQKPLVRISGEVSNHLLKASLYPEIKDLVMVLYNKVQQAGYSEPDFLFDFGLRAQKDTLAENSHAGDSGNPIAVAYRNTPNHLPWERFLAVDIRDLFDTIYQQDGFLPLELKEKTGLQTFHGLGADGKVGVNGLYDGAVVDSISSITLALEHDEYVPFTRFREYAARILRAHLTNLQQRYNLPIGNPALTINGLEAWTQGGWKVDEGSREAKPYRDFFGTYGVMEDSPAGEDPTKPSGTGTFLARYIAVQVVGNDLADFARVALTYTIGQEEVGLNITTDGTGKVSQEELHRWVRNTIPLGLHDTIERFNLRDPALYRQIVDDSDFFHRPDLPWNKFEIPYP